MPNPYGSLAGFTDKAIPGWQERLMARVNSTQANSATRRKKKLHPLRNSQFHVYVSSEYMALFRRAAQSRDISMVAYARRAIAAFISHDLGVPFADIVALTPAPRSFEDRIRSNQPPTVPDDATGYGSWRFEVLR